jgi:cell wall-associated NlpC family hydrolase
MSINPLQSYSPATPPTLSGTPHKSGGATSFGSVLGSLGAAASPVMAGQQSAVERFLIKMMQKSLSLAGDGESERPSALPALEALLAGPAAYGQACRVGSQGLTRDNRVSRPGSSAQPAQAAHAAPAPESSGAAPVSGSGGDRIESTAAQYLGTPYRFGGEGADGIDCSSFVQQVFREHQVNLPRTAREQSLVGSEVAQGDLRKGDLVFFHTYADYPSHVGIYLGEGKMIHASSGKGEVTVSDLNSDYYRSRYLGAKRVA